MGVQIATRHTWALQKIPPEGGCFRWKLPSSPGQVGGNHLPYFCYKMAFRAEGRGFSTLGIQNSLKINEKKKKKGENPSRGASVSPPWCFRDQFHEHSSPFFVRSSIFNRLVFDSEALNSFYAPLGAHSCFACFHLHLVYFQYSFSLF